MRIRTFVLAATAVGAMLLSSCGVNPQSNQPPAESPAPASASPTPEPVQVANVDPSKVPGLHEATLDAPEQGVNATTPLFDSTRLLSAASEVVKDKFLRNNASIGAESSQIDWELVAAGPQAVGLLMTNEITGGEQAGTAGTTIWYDPATNEVHGSAALISENEWEPFLESVRAAAEADDADIETEVLIEALNTPAIPYGHSPAMAFEENGNLVIRVEGAEPVDLRLSREDIDPLLSEFGTAAQQAATEPSEFTGPPPPEESPTPAPGAETPGAETPGAETPGAETPGAESPVSETPGSGTPGSTPTPESSGTPGADASSGTGTDTITARPSTLIGPDCTEQRCIGLTYDDGPGPGTADILEIMRENGATATFFQLGEMLEANPEAGKQVAAEGHEVASHTWSHPDLASQSRENVEEELSSTNELMAEVYGRTPLLMRPPYGSHNEEVDEVVGEHGMSIVQWSVDTMDWETLNAATTATRAVAAANTSGNVVLMHDIHDPTIVAAADIFPQLAQDPEVEFVTISEMGLQTGGLEAGHAYCSGPWAEQAGYDCEG